MEQNKTKKVLKAGLGYILGNYLLKGLSFFSIPLFSRLMSTADYGQYNTFVAYESIVFVFIGLALHSSFKNAKYKFENNFNSYVSSMYSVAIVSLAIWVIVTNITYHFFGNQIGFSRGVINLLLICSFGSALIQCFNAYVGLDYKFKRFLAISGFNVIASITLSVLLICTVFKSEIYLGRIIGTAIPMFLISIYIIYDSFKKERPNFKKEFVKYGVLYSLPIIPHGISQVVLSQFDRIMINSMIGSAEAGIYSFAYNIYIIIQVTSNSLDNVWGPWFYEMMNSKKYNKIKRTSTLYITGVMAFSSIVILVSPEIIMILSPKPYWRAIYTVVPIVIGGYFSFLYLLPVQVEYYYEKTKSIAGATCVAAAVNIGLNAYFIQHYGYVAAAYTTLATYFIYFIFHYILSCFVSNRNLFSIPCITLNIVCICIVGILTLVLIDFAWIRILTAMCIFIVLFCYFNYRFHITSVIKNKLRH